jgi:hypothetical protein
MKDNVYIMGNLALAIIEKKIIDMIYQPSYFIVFFEKKWVTAMYGNGQERSLENLLDEMSPDPQ